MDAMSAYSQPQPTSLANRDKRFEQHGLKDVDRLVMGVILAVIATALLVVFTLVFVTNRRRKARAMHNKAIKGWCLRREELGAGHGQFFHV